MRVPGTNFDYGRPQFFATLLLLAFLAQSILVAASLPLTREEVWLIREGLAKLGAAPATSSESDSEGRTTQVDVEGMIGYVPHSLTNVLAALPIAFRESPGLRDTPLWVPRLGFLVIALFLGGSIWWVARRLYGNAAGYVALVLYSFSPLSVLQTTANAHVGLALGWFGIVFLSIGLAHNLYAPPRHWITRSLLLVLAMVVGLNLHGGVTLAIPLALLFMLYLAPGRRRAAVLVWTLAVVTAILVWNLAAWGASLLLPLPIDESLVGGTDELASSRQFPTLSTLIGVAVCSAVFFSWRRSRYFGNWAPLAVFALLAFLTLTNRHVSYLAPLLVFSYIFIAGISADLLETRYRRPVAVALVVLLTAHAAFGIWTVLRITQTI